MVEIKVNETAYREILSAHGAAHSFGVHPWEIRELDSCVSLASYSRHGAAYSHMLCADRVKRGSSLGIGL